MSMMNTVAGRLFQAFLLLLVMSLIGFIGIHAVGNPVYNIVNIETATKLSMCHRWIDVVKTNNWT